MTVCETVVGLKQPPTGCYEQEDRATMYMRAMESGDTDEQASIATKKQQLRDITADAGITNATTADQLKAVRPTILDNV